MVNRNALRGCALSPLLLLAASAAALADPVTLVCNLKDESIFRQDEPTTLELNETNSTVVVHFSGLHLKNSNGVTGGADGRGGSIAHTIGPLSAQFGPNTITFGSVTPTYGDQGYVLNRLTGDFKDVPATVWVQFTCHAAQKQF